jgi:hypothetical protein
LLTSELVNIKLKTRPDGIKIDRSGWAWKGHLSGGGKEVRGVLRSGAVVVWRCETLLRKLHCEPVLKFDWILDKDAHPEMVESEVANELRVLVS